MRSRSLPRSVVLSLLALPLATAVASAQPGPLPPTPLPPVFLRPLTLVSVGPKTIAPGQAQSVDVTYRGKPSARPCQVAVEWTIYEGAALKGRDTQFASLAPSGVANGWRASLALDLKAFPNATRVDYRVQALALSWQGGGVTLVAQSLVDKGSLAAAPVSARFVQVSATQFGGGFGTPPPYPVTPPPPSITFVVTFANTGSSPLLASDPSLGVQVTYRAPGAGSPVETVVARLDTTIPAGGKADESLTKTLKTTVGTIEATCVLVRLDPATGKVVGPLTAPGSALLTPPVFFPP